MEENQKITFELKHFENSRDKDFSRALKIYNDTIPVDTKTGTNEIIFFADNCNLQENRKMLFFGLYINNSIVGFVEAGYLKKTKTIIIDYIVIKEEYHLNSAFYPLFGLLQKYFSDAMIDYDYIVTEVSTKCPEESVDSESFFSKKMLQLEDFRIADQIYIQPQLGIYNIESNFQFQLMIRSAQPLVSIQKETYLAIVKDIYYEHYYAWYAEVDKEHAQKYKEHIDEQYTIIEEQLKDNKEIKFSVHNPICEYYRAPDCHYTHSTAGFINEKGQKSRPILLIGIPIMTIIVFILSLIIFAILNKYQISVNTFVPIFAAVTAICTSIFTIAFTRISKL
ncbi:MAG: hypothetical protein ACLRZ9_11350 [Eubacterium sp.]